MQFPISVALCLHVYIHARSISCGSDAVPFKGYLNFLFAFQMLFHLKDISIFFCTSDAVPFKGYLNILFVFQMLLHLKDFSQKMMSRTHEIEKQVDTLMHEAKVWSLTP